MNKHYTLNLYGVLAFFCFSGAATFWFFYRIGNVHLIVGLAGLILLSCLGTLSVITIIKGEEKPALKRFLKVVLVGFTAVFAIFLFYAAMLSTAL